MKQLADLTYTTRIYLDESSPSDWLAADVLYAINSGYHETIGHVIEVYEDFYNTITPFTYALVLNQQEYAIDPSLIKVTRVEINYQPNTPNSTPSRCISIKMDELRQNLANTNTQGTLWSPGYYLHGPIGSQTIGFVPVPTLDYDIPANNTKSIAVWGEALPVDLVNTTDNVNIPYADRFAYLVALRAAAQLLRKGQQEENAAARYLQEYMVGVQQMQTFLKERQSDGPMVIEDSLLEDIDFSVLDVL